jgi:hypothetical protein
MLVPVAWGPSRQWHSYAGPLLYTGVVNFKFRVRCPCNTLEENRLKHCGLVVRPTGRLGRQAATVIILQQILYIATDTFGRYEFSDYNPEGFGWAS